MQALSTIVNVFMVNTVGVLQEIGKSYAGKTVLVVTHGEVSYSSSCVCFGICRMHALTLQV
jgi:broad specificity phosphatase PhoE